MDKAFIIQRLRVLLLVWHLGSANAMDTSTYWQQKELLLAQEENVFLGQGQILSPEEEIVNDILMTFKKDEMDAAFRNLDFPPAKNFLVAKDEIKASDVFKILQLMPKGAALHIHDGAGVSTKWIISELSYWNDLYMCFAQDHNFLMKFMSSPDATCTWQLVSDVRASYQTPEEFDKELLGKLSLVTENPQEKYRDINAVWTAFEFVMVTLSGLVKYRPAWEVFLYRLFLELAQDNILYVELRTSLSSIYELDGTKLSEEQAIVIYEEIGQRFMDDHSQEFFGNRLIYSGHKSWDVEAVWRHVNIVKKLKQNHPDYVAGFDLVGQEDLGAPFKHLIEPLLTLSSGDVQVPVFYHAGETNWMGMSADENLLDALLLNTSRIGHGYAISKHPLAKQMARERDVPLEVCPVSNQVLMLITDLRNHPAAGLISEGFPIVISADGPGPFGSKGLSYDFYEAFMALGGAKANLRFLKQLAINSIKYSSLKESETEQLMRMWQEKWNEFITSVARLNISHGKARLFACSSTNGDEFCILH